QLGQSIVQRLAALTLQERDEMRGAALQDFGGPLQRVGPRSCRRRTPASKTCACGGDGRVSLLWRNVADAAGGRHFLRRDRIDELGQRCTFTELNAARIAALW